MSGVDPLNFSKHRVATLKLKIFTILQFFQKNTKY